MLQGDSVPAGRCSTGNTIPPCLQALALALACLVPSTAMAQGFPNKAMRFIVRVPPGGTDDLIARLTAPEISKVVGSEVVVSTPDQMLQSAKKEADLIERIVRTAGIKPE